MAKSKDEDIRIYELPEVTSLPACMYVAVDNETNGTKKYNISEALDSMATSDSVEEIREELESKADTEEVETALADKEDKFFVAEFNVTSYGDIKDAYDAGNKIVCQFTSDSNTYILNLVEKRSTDIGGFIFYGMVGNMENCRINVRYDGSVTEWIKDTYDWTDKLLPSITSDDRGKVLTVNNTDDAEWKAIQPESKGCIYFNKKTGSDDNDGLTKDTPVKTEQKLVELLREKEYDRIFLTKTIGNSPEEDYDDYGTSKVVIDTGIAYKWKRLHIGGEGDSIQVIFGTLTDVPTPPSGVSANLDAIFIESESGISVTGTTALPVSIFVKQTGEASAYKREGIDFTDLHINGLNSVTPFDPRDYSLKDIKIFAESVGDISGYIGINTNAAQGYNFLRDRIATVLFKSEKTVTANIRGCDQFIVRADSAKYTYQIKVAEAADFNIANRCELGGQILAGTDKTCATVSIIGGTAQNSELKVANINPYYGEAYVTDCSPIVNINWQGNVEHTGLIESCQYTEKVGKYADAANGLNLTAYYYGGYDSNDDLIIRNSPVYIESDGDYRIEQITTYADGQSGFHTPVRVISNGDLSLAGGTTSTTIMSMDTFIQATGGIINQQRTIALMPAYANGTTDLVRMPYTSTLRSVNGSVIILPYVSDYCALQQLNVFAENGTAQILNNLQLLQLNIKAANLILPNPIYTAELHIDAKVLNVYGTAGRFEIYGYGYEDTQFPWTTVVPVTNSTIKADTLNWLGNVAGIVKFNMRDADTSVRNLDVQISTIISGSGWSNGKCCPILGDMSYYNGEVTGEIGSIVILYNGQVQKRSRWTRDLIFYDYDSDDNSIVDRHWKPTARVSLHLADRSSPTDMFIDASLGDDRYDGLTASRPVRSIRGLYRALKLNFNPNYDHNNGLIRFHNPITLHILGALNSGFRGAATDNPTSFDIDFHVNSTLVDDSSLTADKDYEIYMNFIEIVPEEPNLSVSLKRLNTGVTYAHGFYGFAVSKFHCENVVHIDSTEKIVIDNRTESGDDTQYYYDYSDKRVPVNSGMCTFKSKYITLNGLFLNLYAEATQKLYLDGTSSAVISNSDYDAVAGVSILKAGDEICFGNYKNLCGIGARACIDCDGYVRGTVQALRGDVSIKCLEMSANLGTSYMGGSLKIDAKNVSLSSSCFGGTWSNQSGSEITLNADRVTGSSGVSLVNTTLHANVRDWLVSGALASYSNGYGVLDIKAEQWAGPITMHYLSKVSIDIGTLQNTISFATGGPNTPSAAMTTNAVIKISKFAGNSYVLGIPHNDSQYLQKDIVLEVGQTNGTLVSWGGDGSSLDAATKIRATANGTAVPGDAAYSNFGKNCPANTDCVITILKSLVAGNGISITEDTNSKTISAEVGIVSKSVTVETGSTDGSVTLDNYKYNEIAAVPAAVTDLTINVPAASVGKLQECAFQFTLADNAALASVTAKMESQALPMIAPSTFVSGKIYQGTSVNGLVTIAEFPAPTPQGVVIGGRFYPTVTIGNQEWLAENLDLKFNGLDIGSSGSPTTPTAWYYDNDESTYGESGNKYGLLYNWHAANYIETNKSTLLPDGWHVPTTTEWDALATAVGGTSVAGTKLKSTTGWSSGNGDGSYGFEAFPAGLRNTSTFKNLGSYASFWSNNETEPVPGYASAYAYASSFNTGASMDSFSNYKTFAYAVRLVRTIS